MCHFLLSGITLPKPAFESVLPPTARSFLLAPVCLRTVSPTAFPAPLAS